MSKAIFLYFFIVSLATAQEVATGELYRVRMFFGLSSPDGASVSAEQWKQFEIRQLATVFDGFNVVDSTGYYKGKSERSKIVTIILDMRNLEKIDQVAETYAKMFHQDSVMVVKIPVESLEFIEPKQ